MIHFLSFIGKFSNEYSTLAQSKFELTNHRRLDQSSDHRKISHFESFVLEINSIIWVQSHQMCKQWLGSMLEPRDSSY